MPSTAAQKVKKDLKVEKRELKYLLREFYELKKMFTLLKEASQMQESGAPDRDVSTILQEAMLTLRKEERIEYRMSRVYDAMREAVMEAEKELERSYPGEAEKLIKLIKKAELYNNDLKKLTARGGEIEQMLRDKKGKEGLTLIQKAFTDIAAFEETVDELVHIDLFLRKGRMVKSELITEITRMYEADQKCHIPSSIPGLYSGMRGNSVYEYNTSRLKKVLEQHRYPEFTKEALEDVLIMVQHSDHDLHFQQKMLKEFPFQKLGDKGLKDMAMLVDRVKVNTGDFQVYGSQSMDLGRTVCLRAIEGAKATNVMDYHGIKYGILTKESIMMINERRKPAMFPQSIELYYKGLCWRRGFLNFLSSLTTQRNIIYMQIKPGK